MSERQIYRPGEQDSSVNKPNNGLDSSYAVSNSGGVAGEQSGYTEAGSQYGPNRAMPDILQRLQNKVYTPKSHGCV